MCVFTHYTRVILLNPLPGLVPQDQVIEFAAMDYGDAGVVAVVAGEDDDQGVLDSAGAYGAGG